MVAARKGSDEGKRDRPCLSEARRANPVGANPNRRTASHRAGTESCWASGDRRLDA